MIFNEGINTSNANIIHLGRANNQKNKDFKSEAGTNRIKQANNNLILNNYKNNDIASNFTSYQLPYPAQNI
jgi:hypothetical protein